MLNSEVCDLRQKKLWTHMGKLKPSQVLLCKHPSASFIYHRTSELQTCISNAWHSGDAGVCLWAVHGATELRVFTVVAFCAAWNGGGVL